MTKIESYGDEAKSDWTDGRTVEAMSRTLFMYEFYDFLPYIYLSTQSIES